MARTEVTHSTGTYSELVASRLRELRKQHRLSVQEWIDKVRMISGIDIPVSTAYSYERGKVLGGADIPIELYAVVAGIYSYKTPHGWLPDQWPG